MSIDTLGDPYDIIHDALISFRDQTEKYIASDQYDPSQINKILTRAFREQGIDIYDVFADEKTSEEVLKSCIVTDVEKLHTDQLYHALIGSTRTPYHHPDGKLKETPNQNNIIIDIEKLTAILIKHIS